MEFLTEKPEITAKNYLSVGPGEYPCGNNLYLKSAGSRGRACLASLPMNGGRPTRPA